MKERGGDVHDGVGRYMGRERERDVYYRVGRRPEKKGEKLRESKATTLRERRLLLSLAKAGKDSEERSKATRREGDDLEGSAARALMRHGGEGRGGRGEGRR